MSHLILRITGKIIVLWKNSNGLPDLTYSDVFHGLNYLKRHIKWEKAKKQSKDLRYFANRLILTIGFSVSFRNFSCNFLMENIKISGHINFRFYERMKFLPAIRWVKFGTGGDAALRWFRGEEFSHEMYKWQNIMADFLLTCHYITSGCIDIDNYMIFWLFYTSFCNWPFHTMLHTVHGTYTSNIIK